MTVVANYRTENTLQVQPKKATVAGMIWKGSIKDDDHTHGRIDTAQG